MHASRSSLICAAHRAVSELGIANTAIMDASSRGRARDALPPFPETEDVVNAFAFSSLASRRRAFARGATGVLESRVTTNARVPRKLAARPGGFGKSDPMSADLAEVRGTHQDSNERRVRAGPSPLER
jgi:hypothetical protein